MKTSERLMLRLRQEFPDLNETVPVTEKPKRLYHGHHQRSAGAWSWSIGGNTNCLYCYDSQWNMNQILKAKHLSLFNEIGGDISILPE